MEFWVGVTDNDWFKFLANIKPDEVNFWQPSGTPPFRRNIELFLFKLHSSLNYITGGGYFISYSNLPISIAWEAFGEKNGTQNYEELRNKIIKYRESKGRSHSGDPEIGCSILGQPFFFPRDEWIPVPEDWKPNIVRGKMYNTKNSIGADLYSKVQQRISTLNNQNNNTNSKNTNFFASESAARYGEKYLTQNRLGQGAFRVLVTDAYQRRCAVTGERTLPALDAAHIKPYAQSGSHTVNNGLLLRADLHRLFDRFYITITPNYCVEVSSRIKEEYENGRDYYIFHGNKLEVLPIQENDLPSQQYIEWHNNHFVA